MPRGRPPKPTVLKVLEGNAGKRPLNHKEPRPTASAARPEYLVGAAADEWDRAVGAMPPGFYTAADVPVLAIHSLAWSTYRAALGQVAREGMTSVGSMGQTVPHPSIAVAARCADLLLRASDRLGGSPVARARLEMPDDAPPSKFDGLLGPRSP
jgi:P27 family predicted phage terminase small subunit